MRKALVAAALLAAAPISIAAASPIEILNAPPAANTLAAD